MSKDKTKVKHHQIHLIDERCKGCSFCIEFCPQHILYQSTETNSKGYHLVATSDSSKCDGCESCSMVCPEFAIYVDTIEEEP